MDIRQITPTYFVAPQLQPEDFGALAAQGITRVICNRPDEEVPPPLRAAAMAKAAAEAGLRFDVLPLTQSAMTAETAAAQRALCDGAAGPVLAYCRSGTRSTVIWALGQAGRQEVDEIIDQAAAAGYDLRGLRALLQG